LANAIYMITLKKATVFGVNLATGTWGTYLDGWPLIIVSYHFPVQEYQGDIASRIIRSIAWAKVKPDRSRAA
jgi:hypothetical protein